MSMAAPREPRRDRINTSTPMRCPICGGQLSDVLIRDLGGVTADITWQVHAGKCDQHGWFQTEVVSRPPREIFSVTRPFGAARRIVVDGREHFSFSTTWNDLPLNERRQKVDPLEARYWQTKPLTKAAASRSSTPHS